MVRRRVVMCGTCFCSSAYRASSCVLSESSFCCCCCDSCVASVVVALFLFRAAPLAFRMYSCLSLLGEIESQFVCVPARGREVKVGVPFNVGSNASCRVPCWCCCCCGCCCFQAIHCGLDQFDQFLNSSHLGVDGCQ